MSKTNILIVEDESIVAKDIQHSLKKLGYNVYKGIQIMIWNKKIFLVIKWYYKFLKFLKIKKFFKLVNKF